MKITFWKNNKLNQEYQIELLDILKDFTKSKYETTDYKDWMFERRFNVFLSDKDYGAWENFTDEEFSFIYKSYKLLNQIKQNYPCFGRGFFIHKILSLYVI